MGTPVHRGKLVHCGQIAAYGRITREKSRNFRLELACAMHGKFLTSLESDHPGIVLAYCGWLGQADQSHGRSSESFNTWLVIYHYDLKTGQELPAPPQGQALEDWDERMGVEWLFSFEVGRFDGAKDVIPLEMGPFHFDVKILFVCNQEEPDVDAVVPQLKMTLRQFFRAVVKPSNDDRWCWRHAPIGRSSAKDGASSITP